MRAARSMSGCIGPGAAFAVLIGAVLMLPNSATFAQEASGPRRLQLRIASVDVASTRVTSPVPEETAPVWRHTFGAERRAEAVRKPVPISADIVVLRGVTSLAPVRQMFPARAYYVLVSRQILQQPDAAAGQGAAVETTALAIRRDIGLRVMAQDHLLHLAEPPLGKELRLAAGTAVRLVGHGRTIWALAIDLAQGCPGAPAPTAAEDEICQAARQQLDAIDEWLVARMGAGETVIIGGRLHRGLEADGLPGHLARLSRLASAPEASGPCTDHAASLASMHVLAGPDIAAGRIELSGGLEPVDKSAPENGCLLMVNARL